MKATIIILLTFLTAAVSNAQNDNSSEVNPFNKIEITAGVNYSQYQQYDFLFGGDEEFTSESGAGYSLELGYTGLYIGNLQIRMSTGIENIRGKFIITERTGEWYNPTITLTSGINQTNFFIAVDPVLVKRNKFDLSIGVSTGLKINEKEDAVRESLKVYRIWGVWYSETISDHLKIGNKMNLGARLSMSYKFNVGKHLSLSPRFTLYSSLLPPFNNTADKKIYNLRQQLGLVFGWR